MNMLNLPFILWTVDTWNLEKTKGGLQTKTCGLPPKATHFKGAAFTLKVNFVLLFVSEFHCRFANSSMQTMGDHGNLLAAKEIAKRFLALHRIPLWNQFDFALARNHQHPLAIQSQNKHRLRQSLYIAYLNFGLYNFCANWSSKYSKIFDSGL